MIELNNRALLWVLALSMTIMSGCPWDTTASENKGDAGVEDAIAAARAAGGSEAVEAAIARAADERFPEPPTMDTLCSLKFGSTQFDKAKKLFGKPQGEEMDKSHASLSYRYKRSITLYMTFDWNNGEPGAGALITGIGLTPEDFISGYKLAEASLAMAPYPSCWPHEEE